MSLDQKAMGVLKLYLWDYPIEDNKWHLFDKWGIQQQPWAEREGKRGYLYRYREDGSELVRAIIVNYFDPPKPLAPGQKAKRTAMDEDDDAERPAVLAVLPYINCVTWHPESQDQVNHFLEETFHFFHPEGNGRFVLGYRRTGLSHWTESNADLNVSDEGLNPFIQERTTGNPRQKGGNSHRRSAIVLGGRRRGCNVGRCACDLRNYGSHQALLEDAGDL